MQKAFTFSTSIPAAGASEVLLLDREPLALQCALLSAQVRRARQVLKRVDPSCLLALMP